MFTLTIDPSNPEYFPVLTPFIQASERALRTLFATPHAHRACPVVAMECTSLTAAEASQAGALMRVNHVGEVCAQALYSAQSLATKNPALSKHFARAAREEADHLAWTHGRLDELGARPSMLNPVWYAGAFALGFVAAKLGDKASLAFVVETERQVEAHLQTHLDLLPQQDHASRAIVAQMKMDEAQHAADAVAAGAPDLPGPVKLAMRAAAKVMTTTAHYV